MVKKVLSYLILWKVLILLVAVLAIYIVPRGDAFFYITARFRTQLPYLAWIWGNFDGAHYLDIARRGYQSHEYGFFPLYPFLIWLVHYIFNIPRVVSAIIIPHVAIIASVLVIIKLLKIDKKTKWYSLFFIVVLTFPTSFFYQALYNDSLFLFLATCSLYFGRQKKWFISSLFGVMATLARLNGLALFFFIIFEYIQSEGKKFKAKILSAFLIPLTFLAYLIYINFAIGSWKNLFSSMKIWNQDRLTFPLQVFWRYLKIFISVDPRFFVYWVAVFEMFFVLFYIFLLIWSYKKIRFSYWIFFAISVLIPSLTGSFQGMPRYGLHIYPFFLVLTMFLQKKTLIQKIIYFSIAIILSFLYIGFFTRGYFVA